MARLGKSSSIACRQASLFGDSGLSADPDLTKNLARVKDRFQTLDIDRTDISTVISRRMLIKSDEQKSQIRSLLQKYTESFENLERDMDTFVDLWPVHPKFLEIFHKIHISEKRQVFNEVADFISSSLINRLEPMELKTVLTNSLFSLFLLFEQIQVIDSETSAAVFGIAL